MGHFGRPADPPGLVLPRLPGADAQLPGPGRADPRVPERDRQPVLPADARLGRIPMVLLATLATVIASQAVISGAFSVTRQAVQLGFLPRLRIRHTSERRGRPGLRARGQLRRSSSPSSRSCSASAPPPRLASAYGIAVTGTLAIDTILFFVVVRDALATSRCGSAVAAPPPSSSSTSPSSPPTSRKVVHGGWFPLLIALIVFTLLITWQRGPRDRHRATARGRGAAARLRRARSTRWTRPSTAPRARRSS